MDVATEQLDVLIRKRASEDRTPDPDELEPSYAESVRRYNARRREQHRWEWVRYFERLARNHAAIAEEYAGRAEQLLKTAE